MNLKAADTRDWAVSTPTINRSDGAGGQPTPTHSAKWVFPEQTDAIAISALAAELCLPRAAAQILWLRGLRDGASAEAFLNPRLEDMHDPFLLLDMEPAVERVRRAISNAEAIEIHGDYDVDGVTSTVILKKAIEMAGGSAGWFIPHRLRDGYGMQPEAVDGAAARGARLLVSVDNGIRAKAAIERARELGIDVVVTDHHLPEATLPNAYAIVNPNRQGCGYPNKDLCGAGVAFKLAHGILSRVGWPEAKLRRVLESFLKLVAIATIADIVPITGENRIVVKHGLAGLADVRNAGLRALLTAAGFREKIPNETEIAFRVAPAINASGRMDSAGAAVEMLLTADGERAAEIARRLFELNTERQAAERAMVKQILDQCLETPVTDAERTLVFWGEGWHRGVAGIVASRVVEKFHRPAVVLGVENGVATGSGRSIEAFHLLDALESMRELFTKFGGHAHAAGLTLGAGNLDTFRERLNAWATDRLAPEDMRPVVAPDVVVEAQELDDNLWNALQHIGPFGMGNKRPLFAMRGVELAGAPQLWNEKHLKILVRQGKRTRLLKGFGMAHLAEELLGVHRVDVTFEMDRDLWGGWGLVARACRAAE